MRDCSTSSDKRKLKTDQIIDTFDLVEGIHASH